MQSIDTTDGFEKYCRRVVSYKVFGRFATRGSIGAIHVQCPGIEQVKLGRGSTDY